MRRIATCVAALLAIHTIALAQFRVAVEAVRVDALVTDGRRVVSGLTTTDFEVRDRGVLQQIDTIDYAEAPLSVMLVLDVSASVEGQALAHLKDAASAVVQLMKPADRAALLTFNSTLRLACDWTDDHGRLGDAIAQVEGAGSTTLHDAVSAALVLRDPAQGRALVLVFSDGADTASWLPGGHVVDVARRHDAVVYGVVVRSVRSSRFGYRVDFRSGIQPPFQRASEAKLEQPFLEGLSEETGGSVLYAERTEELRERFEQIVTEFRSRYLLTFTARGVDAPGWHPLDVKLKGKRGKVTARKGYLR